MINSVPKINFCAAETVNTQDLLSSPGQYTMPSQIADVPPDSFEKMGAEEKTSKGGAAKAIVATLVTGLAAFAGLGYAVKKGHLDKTVINEADGFFKKLWPRTKNLGHTIGEYAVKAWDNTLGKLFTKKS